MKNRLNSFISIFGLAIGMAVCIVLLLYVQHELSYDRFNENADNIYRLCGPVHPGHAPQAAGVLADNIPEIKSYARILGFRESIIGYKEKQFKEKSFGWTDPTFFKMFSFKFISGDSETALDEPLTMVITEKTAKKYFGTDNPIGKVLTIDNEIDYRITGVMEDMPLNSHFRYDLFLTLVGAESEDVFGSKSMNHWGWENFLIYFQMEENFSKIDFEKKCNQIIGKHKNTLQNMPPPDYSIQNLKDIHLYSSHLKGDIQPQNSITYVLIFSLIGILLLIIACFNYVNLLTANATSRTQEIGIKKVIGATRMQLALQFIGESMVVLWISFILALWIAEICLPYFNVIAGKTLTFSELFHIKTIFGILGVVFVTGILAGYYPAFFLASLQPIQALKNSLGGGTSKMNFRKLLVGAQFIVVIILISSGFLMFRQINFLKQKDLGFDKEYILLSDIDGLESSEKYTTLKHALLQQSVVSNVSFASRVPSTDLGNHTGLSHMSTSNWDRKSANWTTIPIVHIGYDFFQTLGIEASQGRLFSKEFQTDIQEGIIFNQAAVKKMNITNDPLSQKFYCSWPRSTRNLVGIIDNFHFESLYEKIKPVVFVIDYSMCGQMMIKVKPSNVKDAIKTITDVCKDIHPNGIFEFHLLENQFESRYQTDTNTFQLMGYFTVLTILIAFMGLFGLASFIMKSRTKEMGIRKVLGASIIQNLTSLIKSIVKWMLFANIFAWPIAWYVMNKWLQNFAYRIEIHWWVFLLSGFVALIIALITISWQAVHSAYANPVDSLRNE